MPPGAFLQAASPSRDLRAARSAGRKRATILFSRAGGVCVAVIRVQVREMRPSLREDRKRLRFGDQEMPSMPLEGRAADFLVLDPVQGFRVVRHGLRHKEPYARFRREIGRWRVAEAAGKARRIRTCGSEALRGKGNPEKEEVDASLAGPARSLQLQIPQIRAKILAKLLIFQRDLHRCFEESQLISRVVRFSVTNVR